ncbi:hypothetical protein ABTC28_19735, partial [Acinetobacter baumannii]
MTLADTAAAKRVLGINGDIEYVTVYSSTTRAGNGKFTIAADTVNLHGDVAINGVSETTINSNNDIRLMGRGETAGTSF